MRLLVVVAVAGCGRIGFDPAGGANGSGNAPLECDMRGLRADAPWPMEGYCPAHVGRSPLDAPMTKPTTEVFRKSGLELDVDMTMGIAIDVDGTVYVEHGATNTEVFATDLQSQTPLWQLPTPGGNGPYTPTIGADGTVWMICQADNTSWCGRTPQGAIVTVTAAAGSDRVRSSATIGGDGLLRWVDADHGLHAAGPGLVGWSPPRAPNGIDGADPAVSLDNRTFINDDRGVTTVFDAAGGLVDTIDPILTVPGNFGSPAVIASDNTITYGVVSTKYLVVLSSSLAPSVLTLSAEVVGLVAAADGTRYVVDIDHAMHTIRGTSEVGATVEGWSAPVLASNHVLLVGANARLLAYDTTRTPPLLLWTYTFDTQVTTVRLAANGRIVVATSDEPAPTGSIRAIE